MLVNVTSEQRQPLPLPASAPKSAQPQQQFTRGDRASVSVRLRKKKTEAGGGGGKRLGSRHSGDFSFFSSASGLAKMEAKKQQQQQQQQQQKDDADDADEDDWSYITFPNGVTTVTDIKTAGEREPVRTPVKVVSRQVPGLSMPFLNSSSKSAGSAKVPESGLPESRPVAFRNKVAATEQQQQRRKSCFVSQSSGSSAASGAGSSSPASRFRRRSEQVNISASKNQSEATEFQYVRNRPGQLSSSALERVAVTASSETAKSAVTSSSGERRVAPLARPEPEPRRQVGLGRRSATQLQFREKKNSYNAALFKSQENLVKACVLSDEDDDAFTTTTTGTTSSTESGAGAGAMAMAGADTPPLHHRLAESATLRKGLLWQQRDRLFSRWKERYFILTKEYLNCFKRGTSKISEMGEFLFKIKISDMEDLELLDKRGYLTICISLVREGKLYLRKTEGIRDWHKMLKECLAEARRANASKNGAGGLRNDLAGFWSRKQVTDSSGIENWLQNKKKKAGLQSNYAGSTPDIHHGDKSGAATSAETAAAVATPPTITLEELSDLYRRQEEDDERGADEAVPPAVAEVGSGSGSDYRRSSSLDQESPTPTQQQQPLVKMRPARNGRKPVVINRLSLMSDIELPSLHLHLNSQPQPGHHQQQQQQQQQQQSPLNQLEKDLFLRKKRSQLDVQSNDSGNNSISTTASVASSASSHSKDSNEDINARDFSSPLRRSPHRDLSSASPASSASSSSASANQRRRSSSHHPPRQAGLQITEV